METTSQLYRGIPTKWIHSGIPPAALPNTGFAYHSWKQFHDRIMNSPDPVATMFDISAEHFAAPELGYMWVAALFPYPIRYAMANRMLGCGHPYGKRNSITRRRSSELSGLTNAEVRNMPWNYVVPKTTRSIQYSRRSALTGSADYDAVSTVEYLAALSKLNPTYLEKIQQACQSVVEDAALKSSQQLGTPECIKLRMFILISYMCSGRPDELSFSCSPADDPNSPRVYWCVVVRSGDQFFCLNGNFY